MPFAWAGHYERRWLRDDFVAGALLAGLLVPQGIAYAGIAGVAPVRGLYAAAAGLLCYAALGTSRHLAVSPTSSAAAIVAAAVLPIAGADAPRYAALASALAIAVGLLFLMAAVLRLGGVSDFVSKPVLKGFMFGLGLTIIVKQVPSLLGVAGGHGGFLAKVWQLVQTAPQSHPPTLAFGASALVALFALDRLAPRVPAGLVVLAAGIVASLLADASAHGVAVVGTIAAGLPRPALPGVGWAQGVLLAEAAAGIVLVAFSEALGAGRTIAAKHDYEVLPARELVALGVANVAAGLLQGIPVGAGASGSAVNERAGARTQLSAVVASSLVVVTLVALMPVFRALPQAVLAAIVIHAVSGLPDVVEMRRYARISRGLIPALTALGGVLALGILRGMLLAMIVNVVLLLKRLGTPGCSVLGRLPGTRTYVDTTQYPEAEPIPGLLLFRLDGLLFFGNVNFVLSRIRELVRRAEPPIRAVVFNCEAMFDIDLNGLDMLEQLRKECAAQGIELALARVNDRLRALLERAGLAERIGRERLFYSQKEAVDRYAERLAAEAGT